MEPAIIAALVAGGVSLAGLIFNLIIAKQTRQATRDQIRLGAAIRAGEEAAKALAAQTAAVERLRVACWELDACLHELEGEGERPLQGLTMAADHFAEQYEVFMDSWAEAKGEVPEPQVLYLRRIRHQCKNMALDIKSSLYFLAQEAREESNRKSIRKTIDSIQEEIGHLLEVLDTLFAVVNSVRLQRIAEVITAPAIGEGAHNPAAADGRQPPLRSGRRR